ncbi:hypothetical protein PRIPAC_87858 [Pristionchus pacificus]|uniref:Uncharacterized protein n=1 Tax=Pristionchus pacificus TaxID=54126 RepID=A0A2A6B6Q6_PRIPA|nr:hypothetical protein PRIPAC_87858 [Pristionchus pacificus]|eukprot:PDM61533.1 hypothetical protein PRIPAC_50975 [Pristionchus pacificus]
MHDGHSSVNLWRRRELGSFNEVRNANRLIIDSLIQNVSSPEVAIDFGGRERVDVMRILSDTVSCIAFCTRSRRISIRTLDGNKMIADLPQMECKLNDLCWGSDARMLISTDGSSMCRLWDIENVMELDCYQVGSTCSSIDFNRNGQIVATCEKGACIIDTRTGFGETRISKKRYLTSVKWSIPSRKLLYATDNNQSILMFDIRMLKRPALETKLNHSGLRIHSSPDGQFLFVNTPTKATLVDAYSLTPIHSINFGSSSISETVQLVQSSGSSLCCAGNSSILAVPLDNKVYRIDFSPSINHGGRPLVHSILHGHASICKTTAFDEHHLKLYSGATEIVRWISKKELEIEEGMKRNDREEEEEWSDD